MKYICLRIYIPLNKLTSNLYERERIKGQISGLSVCACVCTTRVCESMCDARMCARENEERASREKSFFFAIIKSYKS